MRVVQSKAWAKVNLAFDIVGRRLDGYHDIETVMHRIELADEIRVERLTDDAKLENDIRVDMSPPVVPTGIENIAYRAAQAFLESIGECGAVSISVDKRIPVAAGLGGGSADAASVLASMNELWGRPLAYEELSIVARSVGADVPFCLLCHSDPPRAWAAVARGIGDRLSPLPPFPGIAVVLVKPAASLSAGDVYGMWDARHARDVRTMDEGSRDRMQECGQPLSVTRTCALADWMRSQSKCNVAGNSEGYSRISQALPFMENVLEPLAAEECPEILDVKAMLMELGAMTALMTGSGPTVFGLFESDDAAYTAVQDLRERAASSSGWSELEVFATRIGPRPSL